MASMTPPRIRSVTGRRSRPDPSDLPVQRCRFTAMGTHVELLRRSPRYRALLALESEAA